LIAGVLIVNHTWRRGWRPGQAITHSRRHHRAQAAEDGSTQFLPGPAARTPALATTRITVAEHFADQVARAQRNTGTQQRVPPDLVGQIVTNDFDLVCA
jgi:hypothetical protein